MMPFSICWYSALLSKFNPYLLLSFFALILFLPGISQLPVIDRDEAHFAQASRQMMQTGQYFQIRFQDKTRFQKPPGINWLQTASVRIFDSSENSKIWPYRIPSLLGAILSVLLTYLFASRFVGRKTALLAALLLASSLLLVVETHMAVIDASLLSSVLLMQGALWVIYENREKNSSTRGWAMLFWLAMAYGLVLKGVTPLVGILSVITLCLIERKIKWLSRLHIYSGFLLFTVLSLLWLIMVNHAEHSNYLMQMIHKDLLPKLQGGHESHGKPPLFHLFILPLTFWPASLFLWQGGSYAWKNSSKPTIRFLLAWIIPTWLFFEFMPTKLPQYVLPTFPAIAILCAMAIDHCEKMNLKPGKWLHCLQGLWGVLSIGLLASLFMLSYFFMHQITLPEVIFFIVVSLGSLLSIYFAWKGFYRRAGVAVSLTAVLAFSFIFSGLLPRLSPLWVSRNIAQDIRKHPISNSNPLLVVGYAEPSLVFYLNTKEVLFTDETKATELMNQNPNAYLLIEEEKLKQMTTLPELSTIAHVSGFNYSKGKWISLFLVSHKTRVC